VRAGVNTHSTENLEEAFFISSFQAASWDEGFASRFLPGVRAEELFFEGLAGDLTFHGCLSLSVKPGHLVVS
jgi:hypothetical protein